MLNIPIQMFHVAWRMHDSGVRTIPAIAMSMRLSPREPILFIEFDSNVSHLTGR